MSWDEQAACRGKWDDGKGGHLFYPHDKKGPSIPAAKELCDICPVRRECADAGRHEKLGIWGGELLGTVLRAGVPVLRTCRMCSKGFKPNKGGQLYCTPRCAQDAINARQRARYAGTARDRRLMRGTG